MRPAFRENARVRLSMTILMIRESARASPLRRLSRRPCGRRRSTFSTLLPLPFPLQLPLPLRFLLPLLLTSLPFFSFILIPPKDLALRRLNNHQYTRELRRSRSRTYGHSLPREVGQLLRVGRLGVGHGTSCLVRRKFLAKSEVWGETGTPKVGTQP